MNPIIKKILINFGLDIGKLFVKKAGEKISEKISPPKNDIETPPSTYEVSDMKFREYFFGSIRSSLFDKHLTQSQVDGINNIITELWGTLSIPQLAYVLATIYHETAKTMQPITEYGCGKNTPYGCWKTNSKGNKYCFKNGTKTQTYTEQENPNLFYGRGYVQLTWFDNYKRMSEELFALGVVDTVDALLVNPELANNHNIAINVTLIGMQQGLFTGKKLSDYINNNLKDYKNARRIINGTDKAELIASYAEKFEKALLLG